MNKSKARRAKRESEETQRKIERGYAKALQQSRRWFAGVDESTPLKGVQRR